METQSVNCSSYQASSFEFNKENIENAVPPYSNCGIRVPSSPYLHHQFNLFNPNVPQHPDHQKDHLASLISGAQKRSSASGRNTFSVQQSTSSQVHLTDLSGQVLSSSQQKLEKRIAKAAANSSPKKEDSRRNSKQARQESLQKKSAKRSIEETTILVQNGKRACLENSRLPSSATNASPVFEESRFSYHELFSPRTTRSGIVFSPDQVNYQSLDQTMRNSGFRQSTSSVYELDFQPSCFLSQYPGEEVGYFPSLTASPLTKQGLEKTLGQHLNPIFDENGSPSKAMTNTGVILNRSMKTQAIHTYTANAKEPQKLNYDKALANLDIKSTCSPLTRHEGFIILDDDLLNRFGRDVRKTWPTNQVKVTGGMRAADALDAAGVDVAETVCHVMHLFGFFAGGYDGKEPNEVQNLIYGTAGSNGYHLRMEDALRSLVRKHGPLYVRYFFDPNQPGCDLERHVVPFFTFEFGLVEHPELIDTFRAGNVDADEIKGTCLNSMVVDTLDKRFSSMSDARFLFKAGKVAIARARQKQEEKEKEKEIQEMKVEINNTKKKLNFNDDERAIWC